MPIAGSARPFAAAQREESLLPGFHQQREALHSLLNVVWMFRRLCERCVMMDGSPLRIINVAPRSSVSNGR